MDEDALYKIIERRMKMLSEHILRGRSPDYPTYRGLVGAYVELEGLKEDVRNYLRALDQEPVDEGQ